MKNLKYSIFSFIASLICIIGLLIHNYNLAKIYLSASGKNRALFGLTELNRLYVKLYFIPFALIAIIFLFFARKERENLTLLICSFTFLMIAVFCFFYRFWLLMI